ncbi:TSUP family transporter [Sphingomonas sp.]|uniref:TSUP family transporter n=1 Tax=Sphingomonas sp. TaxID=28214 RepID=UPI002FCB93C9
MQLGPDIIAFLMAVAFVAGMIDAIAGGGGLLTIPALMAVGVPPVAALATNKLQSTFGTGGAVFAFARKDHIDLRRFALPAAAAFAGAAGGAFTVTQIDPSWLAGLVPILLVAILLYFLFGPRLGDEDRHSRAGPPLLVVTALLIGAYDGFFGPGTGSFFTTALVAVFGLGMVRAIAHTKLLNFASNLAALIIFVASGEILWVAGLAMALANIAGGQVGAHAAMRFGGRMARPLLIIMSLGLTAKLLSDPANPLTALILSRLS